MSKLILIQIQRIGLVLKHLNHNKYYEDQEIQRIMLLNDEIKNQKRKKQVLEWNAHKWEKFNVINIYINLLR